jgi:hypothetical protein
VYLGVSFLDGAIMTGVYCGDGSSVHFIQDKYTIHFEGMTVNFYLKKEHAHKNRPTHIILDYSTKLFTQIWEDGYSTTEVFKGVI